MKRLLIVILVGMFGLSAGCTGEIGYSPPLAIPIRVSVNTRGEVSIGVARSYATPIGTFDFGIGGSFQTLRDDYPDRLLIIRVDNEASVYRLKEGETFRVEFDDKDTTYKKVALEHKSDGDIILELERVANSTLEQTETKEPANASASNSCPGAPKQRLQVGGNAYVCTAVDSVALREGPGKSYSIMKRLVPGADLKVIDGPSCANNWSFWKVETDSGYVGWMSEGGDSKDTYFLCPK